MNSKWNYMAVGLNVGIALFGAATNSLLLVGMGVFFTWLNWTTAEYRRSIEDGTTKPQDSEESDE